MKWKNRGWLWTIGLLVGALILRLCWPVDDPIKWTFNVGANSHNEPVVAPDGTVYVGDSGGGLFAVNPDGTTKWSVNLGLALITEPVIAPDGTLYVPLWISGAAGGIASVKADGAINWIFHGTGPVLAAPALGADGVIYVGGYHSNLFALNPDGTVQWKVETEGVIADKPAITSQGEVAFVSLDDHLYIVGPDGELRLRKKLSDDHHVHTVTTAPDGSLLLTSGPELRRFSTDGAVNWAVDLRNFTVPQTHVPTGLTAHSSPYVYVNPLYMADGSILVYSANGYAYRISSAGTVLSVIDGGVNEDYDREAIGVVPGNEILMAYETTLQVSKGTNSYWTGTEEAAVVGLASDGTERWRVPITGAFNPLRMLEISQFSRERQFGFGQRDHQSLSRPVMGPDGTVYVRTMKKGLIAIRPPRD
jgi:outer membrane protein assembly factor BamB